MQRLATEKLLDRIKESIGPSNGFVNFLPQVWKREPKITIITLIATI
jgi:hypothetical protein